MTKFSENLTELIESTGLSKRQFCKNINISGASMSQYLHGYYPTLDKAILLANYFDVSLNYLFGLDFLKGQTRVTSKEYNASLFLARYQQMLDANKITHYKLSRKLDFAESNIRAWQRGALPNCSTLIKLAEYLGCSVDYLAGRADY